MGRFHMNHMLKHMKLAQLEKVKSKLLLWYVHINEQVPRMKMMGFCMIENKTMANRLSNLVSERKSKQ